MRRARLALGLLASACLLVGAGIGCGSGIGPERGSQARFSHPPVVNGSRRACLAPPYTPATTVDGPRREANGRRWVYALAGDTVPTGEQAGALIERLRTRGGVMQWISYALACGPTNREACLHWEGNLCETNVERIARTVTAAIAEDPTLPRPRIELGIELAGNLEPRCASDDLACLPIPYNSREPYDPLGERHADVLVAQSAGACEHDGECVQAGCGNHCVSWELGGAHEAGTCEGYSFARAVFCGCVAGSCAWFTQ